MIGSRLLEVTVHATGIVAETQKKFWSTKDKGQQPFQSSQTSSIFWLDPATVLVPLQAYRHRQNQDGNIVLVLITKHNLVIVFNMKSKRV